MKKWLSLLLAAALLLTFSPAVLAGIPDTGVQDEFDFPIAPETDFTVAELADGTVSITGYTGAGGDFTFPASIGGKAVSRIGHQALMNNKTVTGISVPDGIDLLDNQAFQNCAALKQVELPKTGLTLGENVFSDCAVLTSINLPTDLPEIPQGTFYACASLTSLTIPYSVKAVGGSAFYQSGLSDGHMADLGIRKIGSSAFARCPFTELVLPVELESLDVGAFSYCEQLTSLYIPGATLIINGFAFESCQKLKTVRFGKTAKNIGYRMFDSCSALESVVIDQPSRMTAIEDAAFWRCSELKSINLPYSLQSIGSYALSDCAMLTELYIPRHVSEINDPAFHEPITLSGYAGSAAEAYAAERETVTFVQRESTFVYNDDNSVMLEAEYGVLDASGDWALRTTPAAPESSMWNIANEALKGKVLDFAAQEIVIYDKNGVQSAPDPLPTDVLVTLPEPEGFCEPLLGGYYICTSGLCDDTAGELPIVKRENGSITLESCCQGLLTVVEKKIMGDLNSDGQLTTPDALILFQYASGSIALNERQKLCGDIDGTGVCGMTSARRLFQYTAGITNEL